MEITQNNDIALSNKICVFVTSIFIATEMASNNRRKHVTGVTGKQKTKLKNQILRTTEKLKQKSGYH